MQAAELQAARVTAWQAQHAELHSRLAEAASAMATASEGIEQAMSALETTQHHSSHMLAALLGSAHSWSDLVFYGAGVALVLLLSWHPATAQARLPICIALAACLVTERAFVATVSSWQWVRATCVIPLTIEHACATAEGSGMMLNLSLLLATPTTQAVRTHAERCWS
jgi:hypothetical protein